MNGKYSSKNCLAIMDMEYGAILFFFYAQLIVNITGSPPTFIDPTTAVFWIQPSSFLIYYIRKPFEIESIFAHFI